MVSTMKRGQLSLELIILIFAVIIGGAIIATQTLNVNLGISNNKNETLSRPTLITFKEPNVSSNLSSSITVLIPSKIINISINTSSNISNKTIQNQYRHRITNKNQYRYTITNYNGTNIYLSTNLVNATLNGYVIFQNIFEYDHSYIKLSNGKSIKINKNDIIKIVVNNVSSGKIYIDKNGWVDIKDLPIKEIYINGNLVAENTEIVKTRSIKANLSNIESTLTLDVFGNHTWIYLKYNNKILISSWDYTGNIIIYNIYPSSDTGLNLHLKKNKRVYLEGKATGVTIENITK